LTTITWSSLKQQLQRLLVFQFMSIFICASTQLADPNLIYINICRGTNIHKIHDTVVHHCAFLSLFKFDHPFSVCRMVMLRELRRGNRSTIILVLYWHGVGIYSYHTYSDLCWPVVQIYPVFLGLFPYIVAILILSTASILFSCLVVGADPELTHLSRRDRWSQLNPCLSCSRAYSFPEKSLQHHFVVMCPNHPWFSASASLSNIQVVRLPTSVKREMEPNNWFLWCREGSPLQ
jgi:hypothetical protein